MKSIFFILSILIMLTSCETNKPIIEQESGVSKSLADHRKASIKNVLYHLHFDIPAEQSQAIRGKAIITLELIKKSDIVLDFTPPKENIKALRVGEELTDFRYENGHIVVPFSSLKKGKNRIEIDFIAGEAALNRNPDFLYTLFVPERARTAFPCFDQPNLKAQYELSLAIPTTWKASVNAPLVSQESKGDKIVFKYKKTPPISTYLFAFAVGDFQSITKTIAGREMTMLHRETDSLKVARNADDIFDLHQKALNWLEDYTEIPHPFEKFDFILIPAFQFGGMEHVGNIYYKSRSLMLDESATENQKMSRNSLIAHETAHMWFGDLVTMDWFNDVWLKEVFANFMAAKMVNPNFPKVDHELRFLLSHYPSAYGEDRTEGTHPIQQKLDNLKDAGTLYGRLIYQKAPVVMKQLEAIMGEQEMKEGLQEYLKTYSFGNATWDDLIAILDKRTHLDLAAWSQAWVKEAGMPHMRIALETEKDSIKRLFLTQENRTKEGSLWQQNMDLLYTKNDKTISMPIALKDKHYQVVEISGQPKPDFILPNGKGVGYGFFELDQVSQAFLLKNVGQIEDDLTRSVAWMNLWEGMLRRKIKPERLMTTLLESLPFEKESLGQGARLSYLQTIYWGFISAQQRRQIAGTVEKVLWNIIEKEQKTSMKKAALNTYIKVAMTKEGQQKLQKLWAKKLKVSGVTLSESDLTTLAYELAVREVEERDSILPVQLAAIQNPDRKAEMAFVIPALSADETVRNAFFEGLKQTKNRTHEPWVLTALTYLHHPLRAKSAEKYIVPSLELVEDIQATGGIFFPKRWLVNTLDGHQSKEAAQIVRDFLATHPDYPFRLKNKMLQAADMLFRKSY